MSWIITQVLSCGCEEPLEHVSWDTREEAEAVARRLAQGAAEYNARDTARNEAALYVVKED